MTGSTEPEVSYDDDIWLNAMSTIQPSNEFLIDIGKQVVLALRRQEDYPKEVIIRFHSS